MGDVVNLRQVRKQKARLEKEREAQANRATSGRTKLERLLERNERKSNETFLDGHKRDKPE